MRVIIKFFPQLAMLLLLGAIGCKNGSTTPCKMSHDIGAHSHDGSTHTHTIVDYFGSYTLDDAHYGNKTIVTVTGDTRKIVTNALPNHKTGNFPSEANPNTISSQNRTYSIPTEPEYIGKARWGTGARSCFKRCQI